MQALDVPTLSALLALCQEYMSYVRSAQNTTHKNQITESEKTNKFFKNTLIFTMLLNDLLILLVVDNPTNEELLEISEVASTLRNTLSEIWDELEVEFIEKRCEVQHPCIQSFVFAVENFILRLQRVSECSVAGIKACTKFKQLAQCVSVLETADYSQLTVLTEKVPPTDNPIDKDSTPFYEMLIILYYISSLRTFRSISYTGKYAIEFDMNMGRASYQRDKAELLWICQGYPVIFRQAYDGSEPIYLVDTIPGWWRCFCCFSVFCFCIRDIMRRNKRTGSGVHRRSWYSW